jgi:transcriptional antiterminator Rof (Rho-off)
MNACTHTLPLWVYLKDGVDFDLEIHEVGHQEHLTVDVDDVSYWKNN